jgi:hypothetical protein
LPHYFVEFFPVRHKIRGHELERILKYLFGKSKKFTLAGCTLAALKDSQLKSMIQARISGRPRAPVDANDFTSMVTDTNFNGFYEVNIHMLVLNLYCEVVLIISFFRPMTRVQTIRSGTPFITTIFAISRMLLKFALKVQVP